jgi:hypothetical protein
MNWLGNPMALSALSAPLRSAYDVMNHDLQIPPLGVPTVPLNP